MRKMLFAILMSVVALVLIGGCGAADTSSNQPAEGQTNQVEDQANQGEQANEEDQTNEQEEEVTSTEDEPIKIVLGHGVVEDHSLHKGYVHFKELVEERSEGRLEVEISSGGALGGDRELAESVDLGSIQMALNGTTTLESYEPKLAAFGLPYLFDNNEDVDKIINGEAAQSLLGPLGNSNIRILAYPENGFRSITNNRGPIETAEDLEGLKIRAMESPVHVEVFEVLGIAPTPIPFPEIYSSLQSKLIDAQENTNSQVEKAKYYEVQPYLTYPGPFYLLNTTIINEDFFQSLSEEHQEIIQQSAVEAAEYQRKINREENEEALTFLEEEGMQITELPQEEIDKLKEKTAEVYHTFKDDIGTDFLNQVLTELGKDPIE